MNENTNVVQSSESRKSGLPSTNERKRHKDPFANAEPAISGKLTDDQLATLSEVQAKTAQEWQAAHDADAPRRERVLQMKGCLDGQCCYMAPGQMQNGPSAYKS